MKTTPPRCLIFLVCTLALWGCAAWPKSSQTASSSTAAAGALGTPGVANPAEYIRAHFTKRECQIPMRDGVKLFTAVYIPKDASDKRPCPMLMMRTPYSIGPYGEDTF